MLVKSAKVGLNVYLVVITRYKIPYNNYVNFTKNMLKYHKLYFRVFQENILHFTYLCVVRLLSPYFYNMRVHMYDREEIEAHWWSEAAEHHPRED